MKDTKKKIYCKRAKQVQCNCSGENPQITRNGECIYSYDKEGRPVDQRWEEPSMDSNE